MLRDGSGMHRRGRTHDVSISAFPSPARAGSDLVAAAAGSATSDTAARVFVPFGESVAHAFVPPAVFALRRHCVAPTAGGPFPASVAVSGGPALAVRITSAAVVDIFGRVWDFPYLDRRDGDAVEGPGLPNGGEEHCSDWLRN